MRVEVLLTEDANRDLEDIMSTLPSTTLLEKPRLFSAALRR
jgi:hypothetical protein